MGMVTELPIRGGFYMGTHIVRAFKGMDEVGSTVGNEFIKKRLKVMPYVRVCIFVDGQSGRSVFDKDYQQAAFRKCGVAVRQYRA